MHATSCHNILQKFLTGELEASQKIRLEIWLNIMTKGAVKGRNLSKPEEKIVYQYICGTGDIANLAAQFAVRSTSFRSRWFKLILLLIFTVFACYVTLRFIFPI